MAVDIKNLIFIFIPRVNINHQSSLFIRITNYPTILLRMTNVMVLKNPLYHYETEDYFVIN